MGAGRTPEERFLEIISGLERRIASLESRPVQIPALNADPTTDYKGNIWIFQDGRIHIRLPDGTISEVSGGVTSGGSSGTPVPVVPPQPVLQSQEWPALWSQAYRASGGFTGGDAQSLYYGNSGDSYNGRQSSLIGFDYSAIATALSGSTINKVEVFLYNKHTYPAGGGTVHFGLHSNAAKPGTFGGVVSSFISKDAVKRNQAAYHVVSTAFGAALRDGSAKGVILQSPNDSTSYYGYAAGLGDGPPIPRIRITYTK